MEANPSVRFVLDGKVVITSDLPPTMTVLEYLRDIAHRTGTKEGCAEGDCGACTVMLGALAPDGSHIQYKTVNSCIRPLPTIDGYELVTVESLQASDGSLHPVQQAMLDEHGSQCGFCTPGFVMALFALYLRCAAPTREQVVEALSGNLCRCTGYRPIIDAGLRMNTYPPPVHWSRNETHSSKRCDILLNLRRKEALQLKGFYAPTTTDDLAMALDSDPAATVMAGSTDIGLWITKQLRDLPSIIYIGEIPELKQVRSEQAQLVIGATVPLTEAWSEIVALYPQLAEIAQRFASPPVRNSGTLGGNIANGSPIGDSMPILIALGAEIELRRGRQTRRLPLESFYLGYQRKDLNPGEFLVSVAVPRPRTNQRIANYKVSKRLDQDISAVCVAFVLQVDGGRIDSARIVFGGMAAIPARAQATERTLTNGAWNSTTFARAAIALAADFQPLTDLRATSTYRLACAANLLRRFFLEQNNASLPVRTTDAAGPW
jgi:xanthine dehydrogenase small subunit